MADECSSVIIPKGKYIKDSFNAETFEELTDKVLPKRKVKAWAKKNNVKIEGQFSVEVYPWDEFEKDNFEMYTLTPIKGQIQIAQKGNVMCQHTNCWRIYLSLNLYKE